jgi:uncharacterized membrane protein YhhN
VVALAVAALLVAERHGSRAGVWWAKPIASSAFVAAAIAAGALETAYGTAILAGLCLSWLGDVLLIPSDRPSVFLCGMGSFLLGHVAYAVAFVERGVSTGALLPLGLMMTAGAVLALTWLRPHLAGEMKLAVPAYVTVISIMVVSAIATHWASANVWIALGAVGFTISDVAVARDRFISPGFVNRAWGLPLYYAAQLALAWSIVAEH